MTSNSSSTKLHAKRSAFLLNNCRSYWWLAFICSVVYGFAGPVYTLLKIDSITKPSMGNYLSAATEESLLENHLQQMAGWMSAEGFIFLYISAIILAAIIGCVVFFYLQNKRQVNFYHSQPINRTRLFLIQYMTGLIVNVIPLILMTVVMLLIVAAYQLGAALDIAGVLQHMFCLLLLLFASYNIAVLAAQLTGTMLTHVALNAVLHFCVPIAVFLVNLLFGLFFATYNGNSDLVTASLKFSPLCAAIKYLSSIPFPKGTEMVVTPMAGSMIAVTAVLGAAAVLLAWILYQKRPSEAAGKALVYPISEPLLKAYLMFVVSIAAGMVFISVGSKIFFYFAVIAFAVLTHMTCEVIIQHDFKAMGRRMPQCLIILVLIGAVIGIFRFDLPGYDHYLPEPDQVQEVSFIVQEADAMRQYGAYMEDATNTFSQDEAVKQSVYDLLQPIVEEKQYRSSSFENMNPGYQGETSSIVVDYRLTNGKKVSRYYRSVPLKSIDDSYEKLYDQLAYRESLYHDVLQVVPEQLKSMRVEDTMIFYSIKSSLVEKDELDKATKILKAYQQDLLDRQFQTLEKMYMNTITLELRVMSNGKSYIRTMELPVYAEDSRTMALLQELNLSIENSVVDRNFDQALIFRCEDKEKEELRAFFYDATGYADQDQQLTGDDYIKKLEGKAQLTGIISGEEEVEKLIQQTKLFQHSSLFTKYDQNHFVLLRNGDAGDDWSFQLFYENMVPDQYQ